MSNHDRRIEEIDKKMGIGKYNPHHPNIMFGKKKKSEEIKPKGSKSKALESKKKETKAEYNKRHWKDLNKYETN